MRVGAVVLLSRGECYQSYGWNMFRPLGDLQTAISILDEYEVDEISIIRPQREKGDAKVFQQDLALIRELKTITPVSFGGGVRTLQDMEFLSGVPVERLCLSSAFIEMNECLVNKAIDLFGRQAIVACLPIRIRGAEIQVYNCSKSEFVNLGSEMLGFCGGFADEILVYDVEHEGEPNKFDVNILERIDVSNSKIIISGGVGRETIRIANEMGVASSLIENRILHSENSVGYFRN